MSYIARTFSIFIISFCIAGLFSYAEVSAQTAYEQCLTGFASNFGQNPAACDYLKAVSGTGDANPTPPSTDTSTGDANPTPPSGQTYSVSDSSIDLKNPLSGIDSIEGLVQTLLNVLIVIATPIIVIFIILAGLKYVTAQGDPGKLEEAKRALVYAIIGGVLVVGAVAIFELVTGTINAFRS